MATSSAKPAIPDISEIDATAYHEELYSLFCEVFEERPDRASFRWKYEESPLGKMRVWAAIDPTGKLVGAFSAYERQFFYQGRVETVYQQADGMIHSSYQRCGLFSAMLEKMTSELKSEKVLFHFGYTNDRSAAAMRKYPEAIELTLSNRYVYFNGVANLFGQLFPSHQRILGPVEAVVSPIVRMANRIRLAFRSSSVSAVPLVEFDDKPLEWSRSVAEQHVFTPCRDRSFMEWRVVKTPDVLKPDIHAFACQREGQSIGYLVVFHDRVRNLWKLIDAGFESPDEHGTDCFLGLIRLATKNGIDAIVTNIASELFGEAIRRSGFIKSAEIRCSVFPLSWSPSKEQLSDRNFWVQFPIDRDCLDY